MELNKIELNWIKMKKIEEKHMFKVEKTKFV